MYNSTLRVLYLTPLNSVPSFPGLQHSMFEGAAIPLLTCADAAGDMTMCLWKMPMATTSDFQGMSILSRVVASNIYQL